MFQVPIVDVQCYASLCCDLSIYKCQCIGRKWDFVALYCVTLRLLLLLVWAHDDTKKVCQLVGTPSIEWCSKTVLPTRVTRGL
jgi:hypothetical protein